MTEPDAPLTRLRAQLAGPRGRARVEALLADPDAATLVPALPAATFHGLIQDVGLDEAGELLALATPAQVQGCLDLEVWDRDRVDVAAARPWIAALLEVGFEKVGAVWAGLDPEWRALYLAAHATIYDLSGGEDPDHDAAYLDDPDPPPVWFTPDRDFALRLLGGEDQARLTMELVESLYRADMALARHTILAARSEPTAELEETSYRWRSGRLADDGYVDFYEALALFAPMTPEQFVATPVGSTIVDEPGPPLPRAMAERLLATSFLARAWDRVGADDPHAAERLEVALPSLVNQVLAAARVRPGDGDAIAAAATYATATVALGLETVARGDVVAAARILAGASLTHLHRVGYTVTVRLAKVAASLAPRATTADDRSAAVVTALCAPRPWLARVIDDPPTTGVRPFETTADLRRAAEVLAELAIRIAVAERLGVVLTAMKDVPEPRPALDDHGRTALVRWLASGELTGGALSPGELAAAAAALPSLDRPAALAAVRELLGADGGLPARLATVVGRWLDDVTETLTHLDLTRLDPRFVDGLLVTAVARA